LAGAAGALGVIAAEALAAAPPAQATQGSAVLLGQNNNGATAATGLFATSGESAVLADPGNGTGVSGSGASNGPGITGNGGGFGSGVIGSGGPDNAFGVEGFGTGTAPGVFGSGGASNGPGVFGTGKGSGAGVGGNGGPNNGPGILGFGGGNSGDGVQGFSVGGSGSGVLGSASGGSGLHGKANAARGVGVLAENTAGGTALKASGRAVFSTSGILTVAAGSSKATRKGVALTGASLVLATLQQDVPGIWVRAAVPNVQGRSFTVHLSKAVPAKTKVAWFVVN
jgi:hypothetical protein